MERTAVLGLPRVKRGSGSWKELRQVRQSCGDCRQTCAEGGRKGSKGDQYVPFEGHKGSHYKLAEALDRCLVCIY